MKKDVHPAVFWTVVIVVVGVAAYFVLQAVGVIQPRSSGQATPPSPQDVQQYYPTGPRPGTAPSPGTTAPTGTTPGGTMPGGTMPGGAGTPPGMGGGTGMPPGMTGGGTGMPPGMTGGGTGAPR